MESTFSNTQFSAPGSTDDDLVEGVRSRDERVWAEFVDRYSPLIYIWCRQYNLQPADALDVSQQVFHAVHRSIDTFSNSDSQNASFRGWLFVITKNLVRNYLARTMRGPVARGGSSIQMKLMQEPDSIDESTLSSEVDVASSPITQAMDAARDHFDDRTWQCFWLIVMEGYTAVEVGQRFAMRPSAVRQAKYRVTKRLRTLLDQGQA